MGLLPAGERIFHDTFSRFDSTPELQTDDSRVRAMCTTSRREITFRCENIVNKISDVLSDKFN